MSEIRKIINKYGGPTLFAEHFNIPLNTVKKWSTGSRQPPQWVVAILKQVIKAKGL